MSALQISNLEISEPKLVQGTTGEDEKSIDVKIDIQNTSHDTVFQIITSLRSLRFDIDTQTLILGFSEDEPSPEMQDWHTQRLPPDQDAIGPNESKTLQLTLPLIIRRPITSGSLGSRFEEIDISNLEHVVVNISYDNTPFYSNPMEHRADMQRRLSAWGSVLQESFDQKIPNAIKESSKNNKLGDNLQRKDNKLKK